MCQDNSPENLSRKENIEAVSYTHLDVYKRQVVLVGIVAYRIAEAVGYIVLQPALLYGKHFIESIGNMEAYGIHLFLSLIHIWTSTPLIKMP